MENIKGKTLVFTDQHFGIKGNSESRQKIGIKVIKTMIDEIKKQDIKNVLFLGDYYHQRNNLSVDTINIAFKCLQALAKKCNTYMVIGNHDLFNKNSVDVNSINMFSDNPNIKIVSKPEEVMLNSSKCLLVPWLSDLTQFKKNEYDYILGHFDISSKYLISSYVEEHSKKTSSSDNMSDKIDSDKMLKSNNCSSGDLVGDFVELCKKSGTIFAGHIHKHKEFISKGRKFIFVGSPYQQTLGDIGNECGFYVFDEDNKYRFIEITDVPKHVKLSVNEILDVGIDKFDFSIVKGNIIQKTYDVDVSLKDDADITRKINENKPYEELLPEYQVKLDFSSNADENSTIGIIQKSKLEYMKNYIDNMDDKILKESNVEKDKLFEVLSEYYKKVIGE